jgi:hypothetical protein
MGRVNFCYLEDKLRKWGNGLHSIVTTCDKSQNDSVGAFLTCNGCGNRERTM